MSGLTAASDIPGENQRIALPLHLTRRMDTARRTHRATGPTNDENNTIMNDDNEEKEEKGEDTGPELKVSSMFSSKSQVEPLSTLKGR